MIAQMQKKYPSLKKDTYWSKLSTNFYNDMKDVIDNKKSRDFDTYDDYVKAFNDWYKYTTRNDYCNIRRISNTFINNFTDCLKVCHLLFCNFSFTFNGKDCFKSFPIITICRTSNMN